MDPVAQAQLEHLLAIQEGLYELREQFQSARSDDAFYRVYREPEPLVTVCIATYNRADLLTARALPSVLGQTYRNLQIVIVGDNCTDDTERKVAAFGDTRIQFANLPSRGQYPEPGHNRWKVVGTHAVNRALELCEGSFVAHLDDDDHATPERIERLVETALTNQAEFLWHRFLAQYPNGHWTMLGGEDIALSRVTTGSIFYHRYFCSIPWDIRAYRVGEPGDWNRIRKILLLKPKTAYLDECLTLHHREQNQPPPANEEIGNWLTE